MDALVHKLSDWFTLNWFQLLLIWSLVLFFHFMARRYSIRIVYKFSSQCENPDFQKRAETLGLVMRYIVDIAMLIIAMTVTLKILGIDIAPMLTTIGIVGIAASFGAQRIVQDIVSGFFIMLEDQVRVGDVVEIGGRSGVVEEMNIRMITLRDLSGSVYFIRNSSVDIVKNMTKDFSRYVLDIGVSYREDVDEVIEVMRQVDEDIRRDERFKDLILEPLEILGLDRFEDSAVIIRARTKTLPIEQWNVGREFNRRIKKAFDERGIEIPFPHLTLYLGQGKDGSAAPINIQRMPRG